MKSVRTNKIWDKMHAKYLCWFFIILWVLSFATVLLLTLQSTGRLAWFNQQLPVQVQASQPSGHGPFSYSVSMGTEYLSHNENDTSPAQLLEDGRALGPGNAQHADIGAQGGGRFSFWKGSLIFSSSDNSDPRTNGRKYVLVLPISLSPGWMAIAYVWVGCLTLGLLIPVWRALPPIKRRLVYAALGKFDVFKPALFYLCDRVSNLFHSKRFFVPLAILWAVSLAAVLFLWLQGNGLSTRMRQQFPVAGQAAQPSGHGHYSYSVSMGIERLSQTETFASPAVLLEDGHVLGPGNIPHTKIGVKGGGRFSFWKGDLIFSSSDNSDPRTNGRKYVLVLPFSLNPGGMAIAFVWVGCLTLVLLVPVWRALPRIKRRLVYAALGTFDVFKPALFYLCDRVSNLFHSKRLFVPLAILWVVSLAAVLFLWLQGNGLSTRMRQQFPVAAQAAQPSGHGPYSYSVSMGIERLSQPETFASPAVLLEDGHVLGPGNILHAKIGAKGGGRFSWWKGSLIFSTSDNSDPRTNGRKYVLMLPFSLNPGWMTIAYVWVGCLTLGLLVPVWRASPRIRRRFINIIFWPSWEWFKTKFQTIEALFSRKNSIQFKVIYGFLAVIWVLSLVSILLLSFQWSENITWFSKQYRIPVKIAQLSSNGPYSYVVVMKADWLSQSEMIRTTAQVYEDGHALGPGNAMHVDIDTHGNGRFWFGKGYLYFSSSDNTDPRTNGRSYVMTVSFNGLVLGFAWIFILLPLLGEVISKKHNWNKTVSKSAYTITLYIVVWSIIIFKGGLPLSTELKDLYGFGLLVLGYYLVYKFRGWLGQIVRFTFTLILFFIPLSALWKTAYYHGNLIAGLLPFSDATVYYANAIHLINGTQFYPMSSNRPLFSGLAGVLLNVTRQNLQITLLILCVMTAIACFLLADEVRKTYGALSATLMIIILFYCYAGRIVGMMLSENSGLILGALGLALLLRGSRTKRWEFLWFGTFTLTIALYARAGAFFTLPALILCSILSNRQKPIVCLRRAAVTTSAVILGFLACSALFKVIGPPNVDAFGNFGYTLYTLASGYKVWAQMLIDYPNSTTIDAYAISLQLIKQNPLNLLYGILRTYQDYFNPVIMFQFLFFKGNHQMIASRVLYLLSAIGLGRLIINRRNTSSSILLCLWCGITASIIFVQPINDGIRSLTATIPITGLIATVAVAHSTDQAFMERKPVELSKLLVIYTLCMIGISTLIPMMMKIINRPPNSIPSFECPKGYEPVTMWIADGSYVQIVEDNAVPYSYVPTLRQGDYYSSLDRGSANYPDLVKFLREMKAGQSLLFGLNFQSLRKNVEGSYLVLPLWLVVDSSRVKRNEMNNFCAQLTRNQWLLNYLFYYDISVPISHN